MRICSRCLETKPLTDFGKVKHGRDGLRSRCKICNRLDANEAYRRNPEPGRKRATAYRKLRTTKLREWLRGLKSKYGCALCGIREVCLLDFHHLGNKDRAVTTAVSKSNQQLEAELHRCVILCANHHRMVHARFVFVDGLPTLSDRVPRSPRARIAHPHGAAQEIDERLHWEARGTVTVYADPYRTFNL